MGIFGHPKESKTDDLYEYGYGNESWTCCCATHKFSLGVEEPSEKLFTPNYWKNPPPFMSNQTRCCSAVELARDVVERSVSWGVTPAGGAKFKVERSSPQSQRGEWCSPRCQRGRDILNVPAGLYRRDSTGCGVQKKEQLSLLDFTTEEETTSAIKNKFVARGEGPLWVLRQGWIRTKKEAILHPYHQLLSVWTTQTTGLSTKRTEGGKNSLNARAWSRSGAWNVKFFFCFTSEKNYFFDFYSQ